MEHIVGENGNFLFIENGLNGIGSGKRLAYMKENAREGRNFASHPHLIDSIIDLLSFVVLIFSF